MTQFPAPRLYLVTPVVDDTAPLLRDLDAALGAADVAAVLLRLADAEERTLVNRAKAIAAAVQRRDVALLLDGHPDLVAHAGADGAHLTGIVAFTAAVGTLKPDRIAGAGGLHSRHDAMLAGEAGADYAMFGEPPASPARQAGENRPEGRHPPLPALLERIEWWAELIELPCIGYAATAQEIRPLAQAGADFVALGDWIWNEPQGAAAVVAAAAITLAEPAA